MDREEVIRRLYESYPRREVESERHLVTPNFRFHMRPGWPGREVCTLDELPGVWADLEETFTEYELRVEGLRDADPGYALVELVSSVVLRGGGDRMTERIAHLWRFEGELAAEAWTFASLDEARAFMATRRETA